MNDQAIYHVFKHFPSVVTDTRQIKPDCLFFALKGERFDGNQFASQALEKGARYAVVDDSSVVEDERYLLVDNVLDTLQHLARRHRETLDIPVIGLTGTNGKTTTKELLRSVLSEKYKVLATRGNLNNHIGVPLTLLEIDDDVEVAVIEMGANHVGEIDFLCQLAQPTDGLITNIGKAHLEGFGNFEGVKSAKGELYAYLSTHEGTVFLQGDNPILREVADDRLWSGVTANDQLYTYGMSPANQLRGEVVSADPFLTLRWWTEGEQADSRRHEVRTQLAGAYNLENVLAAIAVGLNFGVEAEQINAGLASYRPSNNRSQVIDTPRGNRVIGDYYNANASSMGTALESFSGLWDPRPKVLILGDMFEMGDASASAHQEVIRLAMAMDTVRTIFVGRFFAEQGRAGAAVTADPRNHADRMEPAEIHFYETLEEAKDALMVNPINDALILIKGSRGIALEGLIELL